MKYYSEVLNKNFDTIEDLEAAEKAKKKKYKNPVQLTGQDFCQWELIFPEHTLNFFGVVGFGQSQH